MEAKGLHIKQVKKMNQKKQSAQSMRPMEETGMEAKQPIKEAKEKMSAFSMMEMSIRPAKYSASPDPSLQFVFAMFALMSWVSVNIKMTPDASFVMGILQISLGVAAFTGSRMNLRRGDPHGNINLILSVILGFAAGLTTIARVITNLTIPNYTFHPWVLSMILLAGGLYMLCFLPLLSEQPAYIWCEHLFVCLGFLCTGISDLLMIPVLKVIGSWLLFVFAVLALYQGVSQMYAIHGRRIPQGRKMPFRKNR